MNILEHIPIAPHTTFKIGGPAYFFCSVTDEDELREALVFAKNKRMPFFVLGGGSNILVSDEGFKGLVIKMEMKGIEQKNKEPSTKNQNSKSKTSPPLIVSAGAGENWDAFVEYAISNGLYGLENLSAIPGTVGAAPIQNIGAYGADAAQFISTVRAFDTEKMEFVDLSNKDCTFAYRDSLFKHEKGRYIITKVDFQLKKDAKVNIEYKDLKEHFSKKDSRFKIQDSRMDESNPASPFTLNPSPLEVRNAVIAIRSHKLPDWKKVATAGSFFKNPIISAADFNKLKEKYPGLPGFPESDRKIKISLGWILDKVCDAKGLSRGKAEVYKEQALVLVAQPGATADDVIKLKEELTRRVKEKTGLDIGMEVEWVE